MTSGETSAAIKRLDKLYEFDREPVSKEKLLRAGYFAGSFSGEHVAATEFVIGALFVSWGATVKDVFLGLAIGNVLAVLTWTLICAPIAVDTRLTLYWYLRRIGGPFMTLIYNVLNAVLFCILAGCMITVSASAVRIPINTLLNNPILPQTLPTDPSFMDYLPKDIRFVYVVLVVGAVVVTLAILGFKRLAAFASVCAPWMLLMFLGGALLVLPKLVEGAGMGALTSIDDFFEMGRKVVWTGEPPEGEPIGFWKVAAFAWICNLAMHGGLSDMALFRYARKARYGLYSAFGMFLGHYLAWICAGMMGAAAALFMNESLSKLDAGEVGYQALGWAGAIAVIIAGWTTSNPTLYRAGLALQSITPNWSRALVTLVAGTLTTVIACSPFVFTELLNFVGIYGLLLVPAGAIVLTEHWIFPLLGLTRYWASYRKLALNWPALISWVTAMVLALLAEREILLGLISGTLGADLANSVGSALEWLPTLHLFFLFLPVYVLTSVLYTVLASFSGARESYPEETKTTPEGPAGSEEAATQTPRGDAGNNWIFGLVALGALITCVALPVWVALAGNEGYAERHDTVKDWLVLPTLVYFVAGTVFYVRWRRSRQT